MKKDLMIGIGEPEIRLLILCSGTSLSSPAAREISRILSGKLDWDYLKRTASRNGVLPLLCKRLLSDFPEELPKDVRTDLSAYFVEHSRYNLFTTLRLIELIGLLESSGIPVLPFKGPVLAQTAYGNLALRQYIDLDILVQPKHFDEAVEILVANGFKAFGRAGKIRRGASFLGRKKDIGLIGPDDVRVELHWKLSGFHFALPVEIDRLWSRLEKVELAGASLSTLCFEDRFIYLCLHGSRHAWEKFAWVCDLHELYLTAMSSEEGFRWYLIRRQAEEYGCLRVVELGLHLMLRFFGPETEDPAIERLADDEALKRIADQITGKNFARSVRSSDIGDWYLYHLTLKERRTDRLRLHFFYILWYLQIAFKPNRLDEQVFHLPTVFYPLYYVLRPLRLLVTYVAGDNKRESP